jgi:hypothetical protein
MVTTGHVQGFRMAAVHCANRPCEHIQHDPQKKLNGYKCRSEPQTAVEEMLTRAVHGLLDADVAMSAEQALSDPLPDLGGGLLLACK